MTARQLFLNVSAALVVMTATAAQAGTRAIDIAARTCPAEWAAVTAMEPEAWGAVGPVTPVQTTDSVARAAFEKYAAGVVALAEYVGVFVGLPDAVARDPASLALAQAKFDLTLCLMPTETERDRIATLWAATQPDMTEDTAHATLFAGIDQFACMRMDAASARILALDPLSARFAEAYQAAIEAEMVPCA
ncbi:hypothetical protein KUV51_19405 [Tateyamaria omphalii]|uniref:hypothetical protein n=1 Tax=Tateyamaria omphalii TaxID=299262 RepID=UPI001C99F476|nr:hypothetical protein [Tateyamaria omphalii]MBY5935182.1 hypothetical protein [Tateyamaria omphalii]